MAKLLKSQLNELLNKLDSDLFQVSEVEVTENFNTGHAYRFVSNQNNEYFFQVISFISRYEIELCPGLSDYEENHYDVKKFTEVISELLCWLVYLEKELLQENLWEKFQVYHPEPEIETNIVFNDDTFSGSEIKLLIENGQSLKSKISEVKELSPDQLNRIENKIDVLIKVAEESKTIPKSKWVQMFVDSLIGNLIQMGIDKIPFNRILSFIKNNADLIKETFLH